MIKPEIIEYAFDQTHLAHPDSKLQFNCNVFSMIKYAPNELNFTRTNNARLFIQGITSDDLLRYILVESIKIYNAASYFYQEEIQNLESDEQKIDKLLQVFPCFGTIQELIPLIASNMINASLYFKSNQNDLLALISSVNEMRFIKDDSYRHYIDKYGQEESVTPSGKTANLFVKVNKDIEKASVARDINVNYRAVNRCMTDLITGTQLRNNRNEYSLDGTLFASQDVGKRTNQEDAVVILNHPENPEFKLLAVSDGMGGVELGDKASLYTIKKISEWFSNLPADFYYSIDNLQKLFNACIIEISEDIYQEFNLNRNNVIAGATFVGAIVTKDNTIISSVGDSRAYMTNGRNLKLITRDESPVWPTKFSSNKIPKQCLDDLRFRKDNNFINRCIGQHLTNVQSTIVKNKNYTRLLLFSDGVTDLLDTDRIKIISKQASPELLTKTLVDEAINHDAIRSKEAMFEYNQKIDAGKDNATAAAFIRR